MIGIDLGTSNSLIGYWNGAEVRLIKNEFNDVLTPSIVGVDDNGEILIGAIAKERLISHPQNTVGVFKRFMGTEKMYHLANQRFTPIELSALLLKKLILTAEDYLKKEITEAVISIPAYFNNTQREATLEAAKLAGLQNIHLISEPTVAAMSYGFHRLTEDNRILVLDLGGGTFDVSLLDMFDGIMQVEAIAGDNYLGGEDFTALIVKDCLAQHHLRQDQLTTIEFERLHSQCEKLKERIGNQFEVSFELLLAEQEIHYHLSQDNFNKLAEPLLMRLRKPIIQVLNDAALQTNEIDKVLLIGGATKLSLVRNFLSKLLRQIPFSQINPDQAVAVGATIQSALRESKEMLEEMVLTDVCGYTLGVEITTQNEDGSYKAGIFSPMIERNTTIPVSRVEQFSSIHDEQDAILFNIYQGENRLVTDNLKLGEVEIALPKKGANQVVDTRFTYNNDGILEVIVSIPETKHHERIVIQNSSKQLSEDEVEIRLAKYSALKIHPLDRGETRLLLARADRLYAESLGEKRRYIQTLVASFESKLTQQDEKNTRLAMKELTKQLDQLETNELY